MKKETFDTLLELLRADVTLDKKQSCCSTSGNDPICPEVVVASGLRFMMGAHCADIVSMFFISCESARRIVEKFLDAVEKCPQLAIIPPTSLVELKGLENGWDKVSSANGIFKGVVGALDGWLCCINKPLVDIISGSGSTARRCATPTSDSFTLVLSLRVERTMPAHSIVLWSCEHGWIIYRPDIFWWPTMPTSCPTRCSSHSVGVKKNDRTIVPTIFIYPRCV